MNITKNAEGSKLTIALEGRMDTTTAPKLEAELKASLNGVTELVIDLAALKYISSAGLRVLLSAQKTMNARQGRMELAGVNDSVRHVFDITGFCDILTIE